MTPTERIDRLIYLFQDSDQDYLINELKKLRDEFESRRND